MAVQFLNTISHFGEMLAKCLHVDHFCSFAQKVFYCVFLRVILTIYAKYRQRQKFNSGIGDSTFGNVLYFVLIVKLFCFHIAFMCLSLMKSNDVGCRC